MNRLRMCGSTEKELTVRQPGALNLGFRRGRAALPRCQRMDADHRGRPMRNSLVCGLLGVMGIFLANASAQSLQPQPFPNSQQLGLAIAVQAANQPALLATEGVRGVGVGMVNDSLGIVVLVDSTNTAATLPTTLDGFPVSAVTVGTIRALDCGSGNPQAAFPLPVPLGVSGGNGITVTIQGGVECVGGTIGFKVRDNTNPGVVGWISNAHVVANQTNLCPDATLIGTPEYQPGLIDTDCIPDQNVGFLKRVVPINFSGGNSVVDAGFVQSSDSEVSSTILNLGPQVNNVVPAFVGQTVQKDGRTTACTVGTVTAINMVELVQYDCGSVAMFTNNIMITPMPPSPAFALPGDSGSPIVDPDNNAVALLYAGDPSTGVAFGLPIGSVLSALNVSLASSVGSNQLVTRTSRFWFTHAFSLTDTNCATLLNAIQANGSVMPLGFATLPTADRNAGNGIDAYSTLIEALSFYWRSAGVTGEPGGSQGAGLQGSGLCTARKKLAVELIAAEANVALFGTFPGNATYTLHGTTTNFPPDLISQAQAVGGAYDPVAIKNMTALLRQFNTSGITNNLPNGLVECNAQTGQIVLTNGTGVAKTTLKKLARDPMTQATCPGVNNSCEAAQVVVFPNASDPFAPAVFTSSASLNLYTNNMPTSTLCLNNTGLPGGGGPDAVWQITPEVGTSGRQFTVSTAGSNFYTMLDVWTGSCGSNNLTEVACADNNIGNYGVQLVFTADGTNTYYIVGEGPIGQFGKLKLTITSP